MTKIRIGTVNGNVVIGDLTVEHATPRPGLDFVIRGMLATAETLPGPPERRSKTRPPTAIDQRDLLQMMERLSDRAPVLDFMEREHGTRNILELESNQLYHLRWYVEVLLRRG